MTVKELMEQLSNVENKNLPVYVNTYSVYGIDVVTKEYSKDKKGFVEIIINNKDIDLICEEE